MNERIVRWLYIMAVELGCLSGGIYLVVTEHYGWAWIPFLALFCTSEPSASAEK